MTTPMNISKVSMGGVCDERCAYQYKYDISTTCVATNYNYYISLSYDLGASSPVLFNNIKYNVSNVEIYSPSIHEFNRQFADAEIVIVHTSVDTGALLLVCIPCTSTAGNQNTLVTTIINDLISKPLSQGQPAMALSLPNYNLNSVVPKKPFFYYISQTAQMNVIVYGINDGILVDQNILNNLKTLVSQTTIPIKPSHNNYLFYNVTGPTTLGSEKTGDGQIYIDCSPTGNSYDTTDVEFQKNSSGSSYDLAEYFTTENIIIFLCFLFFILILVYMDKFFLMIGDTTTKKK